MSQYPNHTLHLVKQTNLNAPPPWKQAYHETTSPRSSVLSNYPSNPLARSVAKISTGKTGNSMKTHTKQGEVTLAGLRRGYIQASPFYPETHLHIFLNGDNITITGTKQDGTPVSKVFSKLSEARKYLYTTH